MTGVPCNTSACGTEGTSHGKVLHGGSGNGGRTPHELALDGVSGPGTDRGPTGGALTGGLPGNPVGFGPGGAHELELDGGFLN